MAKKKKDMSAEIIKQASIFRKAMFNFQNKCSAADASPTHQNQILFAEAYVDMRLEGEVLRDIITN